MSKLRRVLVLAKGFAKITAIASVAWRKLMAVYDYCFSCRLQTIWKSSESAPTLILVSSIRAAFCCYVSGQRNSYVVSGRRWRWPKRYRTERKRCSFGIWLPATSSANALLSRKLRKINDFAVLTLSFGIAIATTNNGECYVFIRWWLQLRFDFISTPFDCDSTSNGRKNRSRIVVSAALLCLSVCLYVCMHTR